MNKENSSLPFSPWRNQGNYDAEILITTEIILFITFSNAGLWNMTSAMHFHGENTATPLTPHDQRRWAGTLEFQNAEIGTFRSSVKLGLFGHTSGLPLALEIRGLEVAVAAVVAAGTSLLTALALKFWWSACFHARVGVSVLACLRECRHKKKLIRVFIFSHQHTYYMCMYVNMYGYTYVYVHTHICMYGCVCLSKKIIKTFSINITLQYTFISDNSTWISHQILPLYYSSMI